MDARAFGAVASTPALPARAIPAPVIAEVLAKSLRVSDMVSPVTDGCAVEGGGPRSAHTLPAAPERELNAGPPQAPLFKKPHAPSQERTKRHGGPVPLRHPRPDPLNPLAATAP
ncbi:hypothetical protein GCM10023100_59830 [Actinocorallia cavernae]|uniref:Uncharacterized protein n=2 Tax=Actinomycetes TaxID=1760 RepID=A0ABP8T1W9_9ACTN